MRDPEYDRFGPWILEISEKDPIPPVFLPYSTREETPLMSMKIPVPRERRDLKPGDHMYDYLVSLYEDEIEILVREGEEASRFILPYKMISALRHTEDLLDGHVHIHTPEITYDLPYSTVSQDLIVRMIDLIRIRYIPDTLFPAWGFSDDLEDPDRSELGFLFKGMIKLRKNETERLFALQKEMRMTEIDIRFMQRLFYRAVDKRLLESMHFVNDRELEIINHGRNWAYRWQVVYGRETLYIPLTRLKRVEEDDQSGQPGTSRLDISTDVSRHSFVFLEDNPAMERYRSIVTG